MMVWKKIFLFQGCIFRFHVNLRGCRFHSKEPDILALQGQSPSGKKTTEKSWINNLAPVDMYWLVVSTHPKNISQNGNLPQIGVKIKNL